MLFQERLDRLESRFDRIMGKSLEAVFLSDSVLDDRLSERTLLVTHGFFALCEEHREHRKQLERANMTMDPQSARYLENHLLEAFAMLNEIADTANETWRVDVLRNKDLLLASFLDAANPRPENE